VSTTTGRPTGTRLTRALLACGPLYAVLWVAANDLVAAGLYPGYDPLSQAPSELSATGSPARAFLTAVFPLWPVLTAAFGLGVRRAADGRRALRVTGGLLVAHAVVQLLWLPFPMTSRNDMRPDTAAAANDVGHLVLTGVTLALILSLFGFSAAAFGRRARLAAIAGAAIVVVFGALTGVQAAKLPQGEPTPWMGLFERISIAPWLLWMVLLAVVLTRAVGPHGSGPNDPAR
jgi:Protein of unknown function (DUF998)